MGDLRDQLKKAKLLSKKDAKRLAHEDRVHRKQVGGAAGVDRERAAHEAELREAREQQRAADKQIGAERQAAADAAAERVACEELLVREARKPGRSGASRFYFEAPDGCLPCLELPAAERLQLQEGLLSIVRVGPKGSHDYGLLETKHARRVAAVFPERVVAASG